MVAVPVDDQPRQSIAFAPNDPAEFGIDATSCPVFCRLGDASFEEIQVQFLFSTRETARHDLSLGIVDRTADQTILTVLEGDDIAVRRFSKDLQHFAGKYPIVSVQNLRPRFDNNSGHKRIQAPMLNYSSFRAEQSVVENGAAREAAT